MDSRLRGNDILIAGTILVKYAVIISHSGQDANQFVNQQVQVSRLKSGLGGFLFYLLRR
jgi:hypothetical protein